MFKQNSFRSKKKNKKIRYDPTPKHFFDRLQIIFPKIKYKKVNKLNFKKKLWTLTTIKCLYPFKKY